MAIAAELVRLYSEEEYLEREEKALEKSEFYRGRIYAMAGTSHDHSLIASNSIYEIRTRLKGRPCEVHGSDMRIKVSPTGLYTYADASIAGGEIKFEDEHEDVLLNPTVIFEVLSKSTDRKSTRLNSSHLKLSRMPSSA